MLLSGKVAIWYTGIMYLVRRVWSRIGMALYFSATSLLSSIVISSLPATAPDSLSGVLLIGIILMIVHFTVYLLLLSVKREKPYLVLLATSSIVIVASIVAVGLVFRPNYLRSTFHAAAALYLVFLFKWDCLPWKIKRKENLKTIYYFSIIAAVAGLVWVLLFAYYGVILAAPGSPEWMIFNMYSLGLIVIGLNAILQVKSSLQTQVTISQDSLSIDGHDYTRLLGRKDLLILGLLARTPDHQTTCARIIDELAATGREKRPASLDCGTCLRERHKATLCPHYRRLYNQVLKIKQFLETMRIATILAPSNKMNVTREGWALHTFEGVRISFHPPPATARRKNSSIK